MVRIIALRTSLTVHIVVYGIWCESQTYYYCEYRSKKQSKKISVFLIKDKALVHDTGELLTNKVESEQLLPHVKLPLTEFTQM